MEQEIDQLISTKNTTRIVGKLFVAGMVAGIFSVVPVIDGANYIVKAFTNENQVLMGTFFQLLMVVSYVGIPILMYSIYSGCIVFSDLRWIVTGRACDEPCGNDTNICFGYALV